ncbi:MAG TPA: metallophosphoesterase [bacterium]|nr:metallophosphoesterase [bacterium]HQL63088.1 metallophosphoesterase [bacterium]
MKSLFRSGVRNAVRISVCFLLCLPLLFEIYTLIVQREGDAPLPPQFGNFERVRDLLANSPPKEQFAFAVAGDTRSFGTFEEIAGELRSISLDFAVLLGDCANGGTEEDHRFFRAESATECALLFPVFYVVGNHDVSPDRFPITRFEEEYGPTNFSFEYQNCLFIVLRILDSPFSNADSLAFLEQLAEQPLDNYRYRFVCMHIPPSISGEIVAREYPESDSLVRLFDRMRIDYVFAGDFHGYAQIQRNDTTYIVTGGGGAPLSKKKARQFHHVVVVTVGQNSVSEYIIPFSERRDPEDVLENLAIAKVYPWMSRHPVETIILNGIQIAVLVVIIIFVRRSEKSSGNTRSSQFPA